MLKSHVAATAEFMADKALGMPGRERFFAKRTAACALLGDLLNVPADYISFVGSSSAGITQVISAFAWQAGDRVIVIDDEYPSGRYAFVWLQRYGVDVQMPAYAADVDQELANILALLTPATKLIYVSHVSTRTGRRIDIQALTQAAHAVGARVLVDATHSLGVVPVDAANIDFVVCSGYKWLLGSHLGILVWNKALLPDFHPLVGWRSATPGDNPFTYQLHADAARAEVGNPNFIDVYILHNALQYARIVSPAQLAEYVLTQTARLLTACVDAGCTVLTPQRMEWHAGNVCVASDHAADIVTHARQHGFVIWGDHDLRRVRMSIHGYVTPDAVDAAIAVLPALLRRMG